MNAPTINNALIPPSQLPNTPIPKKPRIATYKRTFEIRSHYTKDHRAKVAKAAKEKKSPVVAPPTLPVNEVFDSLLEEEELTDIKGDLRHKKLRVKRHVDKSSKISQRAGEPGRFRKPKRASVFISQLTPDQRMAVEEIVFALRDAGESVTQIMSITGLANGTIDSMLLRREKMQEQLTIGPLTSGSVQISAPPDAPPEVQQFAALEQARMDRRRQFIDKAYDVVDILLDAARDPVKIDAAPLKDVIASMGIIVDKILIAQGNFTLTKSEEVASLQSVPDHELERLVESTDRCIAYISRRQQGPIQQQ